MNIIFKTDCRHFLSYLPCSRHKTRGQECRDCQDYAPVRQRILIIKLGARGDVLRTTVILPVLTAAFPQAQITWVVQPGGEELLEFYPQVDRVLTYGPQAIAQLTLEYFDRVYALDFSPAGAALASLVQGRVKYGFGWDGAGHIFPFNREARSFYALSLNDRLKQANLKSYQSLILELMGFPRAKHRLSLSLPQALQHWAADWAQRKGLTGSQPVLGLNLGAGQRWPQKAWGSDNWLRLIELLSELHLPILLYGGKLESAAGAEILAQAGDRVIATGWNNTLGQFFALLQLSSLVVTADSLALHAAIALHKPVIALFGPTSSAEIELYGQGDKLVTRLACRGCYRTACSRKPYCTQSLQPQRVYRSILSWLKR